MMKITLLLGSVRQQRQTHKVAFYLEKMLKERGIETNMVDLMEHKLPIFDENPDPDPTTDSSVQYMGEQLDNADGIILLTPEYHGSFSGVLKNTLDYFGDEFNRKPVGVVAVSAGHMGGINAATQLQHVILSMGAFPMPVKWLVSVVQHSFDAANKPANEQLTRRAKRFLDELIWFTDAISQKKMAEKVAVS